MANTISLLVRQQLPEFVRSNYDTFVAFVESYYAWMDSTGQVMNLGKSLPDAIDLDASLDAFITEFIKQYLPLFPADQLSRPELIIQHAKEMYRTKGTDKSVRLLFRLLYGQDIEVYYPKTSVLRASSSGWVNMTSLRLDPTLWTLNTGDGTTTRFRTLDTSRGATVSVYLNGVLQSSGYRHSPNEPYVIFDTAPAANIEVKITYNGEELIDLIETRQIIVRFIGQTSGASAVSESLQQLVADGITQLDLLVSQPLGTFSQSEVVRGRWVYDLDSGAYIDIYARLISYLSSITITNGGQSYNVGDVVTITGGFPQNAATAVVDSVFDALISNIRVVTGGVGYQAGQPAYITSSPNTGLNAFVLSVDTSGVVHPNSYPINQDVLSLWANTTMSDSNYYFPPGISENVNTVMSMAFSDFLLGKYPIERVGPISSLTITSSTSVFDPPPTLAVDPPVVVVTGNTANGNVATANISLSWFGILGKVNVANGGVNYQVGDEVSFENIPGVGIGIGAAAEVTSLHVSNTGIKTIEFRPSRVTGTVNVNPSVSNTEVVGTGTFFTTELFANDHIEINSESTYVTTITNNTHLVVNTALSRTSTNRKMGVYGRYFIGGMNYRQNSLPIVHVTSNNPFASGANVLAELVLSGGATFELSSQTQEPVGKIRSIRITSHGYGYQSSPVIDLSTKGNGKATAVAVMISNLFTAPGRFTTTEGFLSSDQRLESEGYYSNYSYIVRSQTELSKYKAILRDLMHPAGMQLRGEYLMDAEIDAPPAAMTSNQEITVLEWVTTQASSDAFWADVIYGGGKFVAVATSEGTGYSPTELVMTSTDGTTWTQRNASSANPWREIAWSGNVYAVVTTNAVMTSPDGITWTDRTCPSGVWVSVTWDGTNFVAVAADAGSSNTVMTSTDGITWTLRTAAAAKRWVKVTNGGGTLVAVASTSPANTESVMTSTDNGVSWILRTASQAKDWDTLAWNGSLFAAVGASPTGIITSPDGITWTNRTEPWMASNFTNWKVSNINGEFWGLGNGGVVDGWLRSSNGVSWSISNVDFGADGVYRAPATDGANVVGVIRFLYGSPVGLNDQAVKYPNTHIVMTTIDSVNVANLYQTSV